MKLIDNTVLNALIVSSLLLCSSASAQTAGEEIRIPAGKARPVNGLVAGDQITFKTSGGRSYCCELNESGNSYSTGRFFSSIRDAVNEANRGKDGNALDSFHVDDEKKRVCWFEDESGGTVTLTVGGEATAQKFTDIEALCSETTLRGNYNTIATEFNFLELSFAGIDYSTEAVAGEIELSSTITGKVTTIPFTLPTGFADGAPLGGKTIRKDFSLHQTLKDLGDFGSITIRHNSAPGTVRARMSQYKVMSYSPLNFELRGQEALREGF